MANRREHGSYPAFEWPSTSGTSTNIAEWQLFSSGRAALRALLDMSQVERVWVPTYYCHSVTMGLRQSQTVSLYPAAPLDDTLTVTVEDNEAVIACEYFGARSNVTVHGGLHILDRSHDPVAGHEYGRHPDACFASLRKTVPIPDGGAAWISANRALERPEPPPREVAHDAAVLDILSAMLLKRMYLDGDEVNKGGYRRLFERGEDTVGGSTAAISDWSRRFLQSWDLRAAADGRRRNADAFRAAWDGPDCVAVVATPSYVCLRAHGPEERNALRSELIRRDVFPAILWPLGGESVPDRHRDLSDSILVLHADHRYEERDMQALAETVAESARASCCAQR